MLNKKIEYQLKVSRRARYMRLAIYPDGTCTVTVPPRFDQSLIDKFISQKADWILKKLEFFAKRSENSIPSSKTDYIKYRQSASKLVNERLNYFKQFYGFSWGNVTIRNQKTRWGSCSKKGNLSFSYRLALLPQEVTDYVVVHELCHLAEFNHSKNFWNLVGRAIPDYKQLRKQLKSMA